VARHVLAPPRVIVARWLALTQQTVWGWLTTAAKAVWDGISAVWDSAWQGIKVVITAIWDNLKTDADDIWKALKYGAEHVWDGISAAWSAAWTAAVGAINSVINTAISGLNGLINGYNSVVGSIPGMGGAKIGNISPVQLATGGIVTAPTLALIGEGGPEMVVPLSGFNNGTVQPLAGGVGGGGGGTNINLYISGNTIMDTNDINKLTNAISSRLASFIIPSSGLRPVGR